MFSRNTKQAKCCSASVPIANRPSHRVAGFHIFVFGSLLPIFIENYTDELRYYYVDLRENNELYRCNLTEVSIKLGRRDKTSYYFHICLAKHILYKDQLINASSALPSSTMG